ncbi:MAG TPA: FAD-dependent oxidoreductase [Halanaerobiales bacterium]|nr:FAD-dependent oxidoreductase [Halanaerobiales bacterium]
MLSSKYRFLISLVIILLLTTPILSAQSNLTLDYDVVVYSGQPGGVTAAVSAARSGLSTLLILKRDNPGGLMTYGGLNYLDLNFDKAGKILNKGLFAEWYERIGKNQSFTYDKATQVFNEMLNEAGVVVIKNSNLERVCLKDNNIEKMLIKDEKENYFQITADYFIDAQQDAQLAFKAGANLFNFGSDINLNDRFMAMTLVLNIDDININNLKKDIVSNRYGPSYLKNGHAYGFKELGKIYEPHNENLKLRGLNIIFNENHNGYHQGSINALLIFNHNPLDQKEREAAYQLAAEEAKYILEFLKEKLNGFKKAKLNEPAEELYIRESRHLVAENILQVEDLLENKISDNTITLASYPLDYQASEMDYQGFVLFNPVVYGIPFDSLLPDNIRNLMVVSRSTGLSSRAASSARVIPARMNSGAAAGKAAALADENEISLKELNKNKKLIAEIQQYMEINISEYKDIKPLFKKDNTYPYIKELFNLGLIIGGYQNEFGFDSTMSEYEFGQLLIKGMIRRNSPIFYEWVPGSLETLTTLKKLDKLNAYKLILAASSHQVLEIAEEKYLDYLREDNLIPTDFEESVKSNRVLNRKEAYYLIGYFLKQSPLPNKLKILRGTKK